MTTIDGLMVTGVDVGAERMTFPAAVLAALRAKPLSVTRLVILGAPGRSDPLGRVWVDPVRVDPTPPVGTPGAVRHGGNSTPARAPVAGAGKSPGFGPVSGE